MNYMAVFVTICMYVLMYRIAIFEKRRGWLWVLITVLTVTFFDQFIQSAYLPALLGAAASFVLMTLANIHKPVKKGVR